MLFGNSPHHCAIPLVSVSSTGEDRRAAFEGYVLGRCKPVATHVSADHEVTYFVAGVAVRYIRQDCVEAIQLCTPGLVLNNAPVFPKTSEIEMSYYMRMNNERRSRTCRRQLLKIWNVSPWPWAQYMIGDGSDARTYRKIIREMQANYNQ